MNKKILLTGDIVKILEELAVKLENSLNIIYDKKEETAQYLLFNSSFEKII